jgi:hypothetical protein
LSHEAGTGFSDPGATATDAVDGVVPLTSSTPVDGFTVGVYTLTYDYTDGAGNASATVTVTVNVVDTTPAVITVPDAGPLTHEAGSVFSDPGATATDAVDGVVPLTSSTPVNGDGERGGYDPVIRAESGCVHADRGRRRPTRYDYTDGAGNASGTVTVTVNVVDTTPAVITVPMRVRSPMRRGRVL